MGTPMQASEHGQAVVATVDPADCAGLWPLVEPWIRSGKRRVILDFTGATYINSMNIAQVISLRHRAQLLGVDVRLANLGDGIRAVFRILRLEKMFALDQSLDAAIAAP